MSSDAPGEQEDALPILTDQEITDTLNALATETTPTLAQGPQTGSSAGWSNFIPTFETLLEVPPRESPVFDVGSFAPYSARVPTPTADQRPADLLRRATFHVPTTTTTTSSSNSTYSASPAPSFQQPSRSSFSLEPTALLQALPAVCPSVQPNPLPISTTVHGTDTITSTIQGTDIDDTPLSLPRGEAPKRESSATGGIQGWSGTSPTGAPLAPPIHSLPRSGRLSDPSISASRFASATLSPYFAPRIDARNSTAPVPDIGPSQRWSTGRPVAAPYPHETFRAKYAPRTLLYQQQKLWTAEYDLILEDAAGAGSALSTSAAEPSYMGLAGAVGTEQAPRSSLAGWSPGVEVKADLPTAAPAEAMPVEADAAVEWEYTSMLHFSNSPEDAVGPAPGVPLDNILQMPQIPVMTDDEAEAFLEETGLIGPRAATQPDVCLDGVHILSEHSKRVR